MGPNAITTATTLITTEMPTSEAIAHYTYVLKGAQMKIMYQVVEVMRIWTPQLKEI